MFYNEENPAPASGLIPETGASLRTGLFPGRTQPDNTPSGGVFQSENSIRRNGQ
jgi:hypothetical protein